MNKHEFSDHAEALDYAEHNGFEYAWEGTAHFEKRKRLLTPDQFIVRPVRTRKGITTIMLYSKEITRAEFEADRPRQEALAAKRKKWRARHRRGGQA